MTTVNISVYGREYHLACGPGEEDHLRTLAFDLDERLRGLSRRMGSSASEHMLMLMTSLTLADELRDMKQEVANLRTELALPGGRQAESAGNEEAQAKLLEMETAMAQTLEQVALRIEKIAEQIELR